MTPSKGQRGRKPGPPEAPDGIEPPRGEHAPGATTPASDPAVPAPGALGGLPQPAEAPRGAARDRTAPEPAAEAPAPSPETAGASARATTASEAPDVSAAPLPPATEAPAGAAAASEAPGVAAAPLPASAAAPAPSPNLASEVPAVPAAPRPAPAAAPVRTPSAETTGAPARSPSPASEAPGTPVAPPAPSLAHLPLPLFAVPMGLGGLGLLWRDAAFLVGPLAWLGEAILLAATLSWGWIGWLHLRRARAHPEALLADLADPVRLPFFGAPTIGLLLIAGFLGGYSAALGGAVWVVALSVHLAVGAWLFGRILSGEATPALLAPPLLIPMVGNILAPAIGGGFGFIGLAAVAFGIGAFLWLMVLPLLVQRFLAGPALPPRMAPGVVILLAPPSVAAVSLPTLTGEAGLATLALFGIALFTALALLAAVPRIAAAPFSAAFWGLSFPTAAFGIALSRQVQAAPGLPGALLFAVVLAAVTGLIGWLAWRTLAAARAGAFLRPQ
jgi:tellurite resistance protein